MACPRSRAGTSRSPLTSVQASPRRPASGRPARAGRAATRAMRPGSGRRTARPARRSTSGSAGCLGRRAAPGLATPGRVDPASRAPSPPGRASRARRRAARSHTSTTAASRRVGTRQQDVDRPRARAVAGSRRLGLREPPAWRSRCDHQVLALEVLDVPRQVGARCGLEEGGQLHADSGTARRPRVDAGV